MDWLERLVNCISFLEISLVLWHILPSLIEKYSKLRYGCFSDIPFRICVDYLCYPRNVVDVLDGLTILQSFWYICTCMPEWRGVSHTSKHSEAPKSWRFYFIWTCWGKCDYLLLAGLLQLLNFVLCWSPTQYWLIPFSIFLFLLIS